ncbi:MULTISPECIES: hypothetical protein [unclassified Ruminococcus]|uniref:hypothetical protein n=1 Tax=unclassified Ruminococcus TaxID=2608920 RepID=UPI00210A523B|nr:MULTISPECIES: hypothetical protein [unclassified Ruminococcus]MCQ4022333.1 hypothetical protein [Ruminococcus sp. zg-924]MCQ4114661.1 hypothetical protein [Ruminococcus sp. zg-921]
MALNGRSVAYDISLFETTAEERLEEQKRLHRRRHNVVSLPEEDLIKNRRAKPNPAKIFSRVALGGIITVTVALIIHGQVQLTELNQKISNASTNLSNQESLYTQLQMKVDSKLSTAEVESFAESNLGMSKADSYQKEYISLSQGDKAEVAKEQGSNIFDSIAQAIAGLWS